MTTAAVPDTPYSDSLSDDEHGADAERTNDERERTALEIEEESGGGRGPVLCPARPVSVEARLQCTPDPAKVVYANGCVACYRLSFVSFISFPPHFFLSLLLLPYSLPKYPEEYKHRPAPYPPSSSRCPRTVASERHTYHQCHAHSYPDADEAGGTGGEDKTTAQGMKVKTAKE
ncbi:hypothetical protein MSAN_01127400 [Mycena sanguinolenta]|uniref:Uncharacterized protein n=1 Tax=Mycena sanguinolenta TaxID=230812 RepID=A0A8H7D6B4_9AGAR|nr:hypothetical protein MSAN_01127400 [Mycena sanguinolenta]